MTKASKNSSGLKEYSTSKKGREEDQALCPICDDVCKCVKQPPCTPTFVDSRRRIFHPNSHKTFYRSNKSGSSFVWDFNIRGQLIPLENLYEKSDEDDDEKSFNSTDAECSDLVSIDESGDHLSDVLSADSEDANHAGLIEDDDMTIYYPVETPSLKKSHGGSDDDDNECDSDSMSSKISAITPQVLAAISKSLCNLPPKTCVLLVSDEAESSSLEDLNDDDDIEMIIVVSSTDEDGDDDEGEEEEEENGDDNKNSNSNNNNNNNRKVEEEKCVSSESDCDSLLQRFRRVPVNAFYRSKLMRAATNSHQHSHTANALRPCSVDPQFIDQCHNSESSGDDLVRINCNPDYIMEGDNGGDNHNMFQFDAPLIYY